MSQVKNMQDEIFHDDVSLYWKPNFSSLTLVDEAYELTEVKINNIQEETSDYQTDMQSNNLDKVITCLWTELISCDTIGYYNTLHQKQANIIVYTRP